MRSHPSYNTYIGHIHYTHSSQCDRSCPSRPVALRRDPLCPSYSVDSVVARRGPSRPVADPSWPVATRRDMSQAHDPTTSFIVAATISVGKHVKAEQRRDQDRDPAPSHVIYDKSIPTLHKNISMERHQCNTTWNADGLFASLVSD